MCDSKKGRYCPGREPARVLSGRLEAARDEYTAAVATVEDNPTLEAQARVAAARVKFDESYTRYAGTRTGQQWVRGHAQRSAWEGNRARAEILSRFADHALHAKETGKGADRPVPGEALVPVNCSSCGRFQGDNHTCATARSDGVGPAGVVRRDADVYDVDGTLLNTDGLTYMVERGPAKDLDRFHTATTVSPANEWVVDAARTSRIEGREVIVLTARPVKVRTQTAMWLARQETIPSDRLVMRRNGDVRPADVVKEEALRHLSRSVVVRKAADDTPEVSSMWERNGVRSVRVPRTDMDGWAPSPQGPYRGWSIHPDDMVKGLRDKENRLGSRAHPVVTKDPHVTLDFGKDATSKGSPVPSLVEAVGYARNGRAEALVVAVDGTTERPDGKTFHVTLSRQPDVAPKESNDLLTAGWVKLPKPFLLRSRPFVGQTRS